MGSKKKLLLVLLAAIVLLYFAYTNGFFNFVSFDQGLNKIKEIDKEFGLDEQKLVPDEKTELEEYNERILELKKEFSGKNQNDEIKALNYLLDAKKELALLQMNLITLQETADCQEQLELAGIIAESAVSVKDSMENYLEFDFSEKTTEWNENALDTGNGLIVSFNELKQRLEQSC